MGLERYSPLFRGLHPGLEAFNRELIEIVRDLQAKVGTEGPKFVDAIETAVASTPPPSVFSVSADNGNFVVSIINPQDVQPASMKLRQAQILRGPNAALSRILHNLQSASDTNFNADSGLADYGNSSQNQWVIPGPGQTLYWRVRDSFDGKHWTGWQVFTGPSGPVAVAA